MRSKMWNSDSCFKAGTLATSAQCRDYKCGGTAPYFFLFCTIATVVDAKNVQNGKKLLSRMWTANFWRPRPRSREQSEHASIQPCSENYHITRMRRDKICFYLLDEFLWSTHTCWNPPHRVQITSLWTCSLQCSLSRWCTGSKLLTLWQTKYIHTPTALDADK